ncbi:LysR family transcriptional regulator [Pseudalkalibacillus berkeleyi]|uniref:LysR family transcriptional regulator n=1 Tax=Pseudalkalibacillus berkeleyi TaxID=1069813 RepID=A0ABS9GVS7_9BACL|nr:LysR family transcriptional regulator [Pseudalkalibacillus berkeleyi]MCF6136917.1 LysR family transcriptional regulator [Pseudalkalibacillus berkeleyi]
MQLTEFNVLSVLGEELNMRKASERLYVSQPALSQRLQSIEQRWGAKLFIRSQKGLTLTPAGEKVIEFVNKTIQTEEDVRDEVLSLGDVVHGTLKLAVASIIGQYWLPKVLKEYVELYPNVKISLVTGWSSEVQRQLYSDNFHVGIIRGQPDWKGPTEHLMSDELHLVDTKIQSLEDLKETNRPFIQFRSHSTYYQEIQEWWLSQFKTSPKRTIVVDQIETCKQMALNGIGYAILPSISLPKTESAIHTIPILNEKTKPLSRDTWIIYSDASKQLKQVTAFIELINRMKKNGHT